MTGYAKIFFVNRCVDDSVLILDNEELILIFWSIVSNI